MTVRGITLIAGAVGFIAAAAQADFIREVSTGTFEVTGEDEFTRTMAVDLVVISEIGGWGVQTISADLVQTFDPFFDDALTGTAVFHGPNAEDFIEISLDGFITGIPDQPNGSFAGTWVTLGSGGVYADLTGSGDFSGSAYFTSGTGGLLDVIFPGDLVPAPGTMGLLGAGALFAARRRRG